jgi:hypothetical protein
MERGPYHDFETERSIEEVPEISESSPQSQENKELDEKFKLAAELSLFGVPYRENESLEENQKRLKVFEYLHRFTENKEQLEYVKTVEYRGGVYPCLDVPQIKNFTEKVYVDENPVGPKKQTRKNLFSAFLDVEGFSFEDVWSPEFQQGTLKPRKIVTMPESIADLAPKKDPKSLDYQASFPKRSNNDMFKPYNFFGGKKEKPFETEFTLASGETINLAELYLADNLVGKLDLHRDPNTGRLMCLNPETQEYEQFSFNKLPSLRALPIENIGYRSKKTGQKVALIANPTAFIELGLSHLLDAGVFREIDTGHTETERVITSKREYMDPDCNKTASFTTEGAGSIRYPLGKKTVVGSDRKFEGDWSLERVDAHQAIMYSYKFDRPIPEYLLTLLTKEEALALREEAKQRLIAKGKDPSHGEISGNVRVSAKDMKVHLRPFWIPDIIYPRADETPGEYGHRTHLYYDLKFILRVNREFFASIGGSKYELPWAEQLLLTKLLVEKEHKLDELKVFSKTFGEQGLRALLNCEYDPGLVDELLELGKKNESEARDIFTAYAKLRTTAQDLTKLLIKSDIISSLPVESKQARKLPEEFQEAILRRAKDMLMVAGGLTRKRQVSMPYYGIKDIKAQNLSEITTALTEYGSTLELLSGILQGSESGSAPLTFLEKSAAGTIPETYSFVTQDALGKTKYVSFQLRENGAPIDQKNPDVEYDTEARINFLVSDVPFTDKLSDPARQQATSFRLDREGKERNGHELLLMILLKPMEKCLLSLVR